MSPASRKKHKNSVLSSNSSSVQDYVKAIYTFTEWQDRPVSSSVLAARLGVANSSVSEMVRKLVELGLVAHEPYGDVELTEPGRRLALAMVRRHRLLETYLVNELGYAWDEVHEEAELLEHTVSDKMIERIAAKLGNPGRDPHGDPIPAADGSVTVPRAWRLPDLDEGHTGRITRISDADPALLRFLQAENISLDDPVRMIGRRPFGGALVVSVGTADAGRELDLGDEAAAALWISSDHPHPGCVIGH
ncbi:metal-dependent transcriptional regulator [Arthrobacter mobilis]|uniref:Manganese transport regulator n=1 Tax=Arthrobacter mobilis TaxID=2724944 RepID=A0A7X6HDY9_9MICC|nr:metal-dependent transcriptional regulator [Arthrobacter mobilis]NKX54509.1 metal-dependent transcriptional regulator [Arthrobacter mobilis]